MNYKILAAVEAVIIAGLVAYVIANRSRHHFEQVQNSTGQLAFDRDTGQRCWTAQPKPYGGQQASPPDVFDKLEQEEEARKGIPLCTDLK